jgi:excisionase family DNA binding protein
MNQQEHTSTEERYLRATEVASLFQVSSKTVSRWAKDGKLPYRRTLGGQRQFPESDIRALLNGLYEAAEGGEGR